LGPPKRKPGGLKPPETQTGGLKPATREIMFTIPNILTIARLLLVPCFILASMRGMYTTAFVLFVSAAVTDSLDGMVARRWNMRSKLGALLDPAADKTLMVCGFLYYTFAGGIPLVRIPGWLTFTVFMRDVLIVSFAYLMYTRVQVSRFPPTVYGKTSTVLQAVALAATIAVNAFLPVLLPLMPWLFRASMLMTLFSGWHYMHRARRILSELSPAAA
jgi:cardiolipin synthase